MNNKQLNSTIVNNEQLNLTIVNNEQLNSTIVNNEQRIYELIVLILPSSAPVEHVFSLLKLVLADENYAKLMDSYKTSVFLQSNNMYT